VHTALISLVAEKDERTQGRVLSLSGSLQRSHGTLGSSAALKFPTAEKIAAAQLLGCMKCCSYVPLSDAAVQDAARR
jgi:hypothetical protein